jgi:hypothetical protein
MLTSMLACTQIKVLLGLALVAPQPPVSSRLEHRPVAAGERQRTTTALDERRDAV